MLSVMDTQAIVVSVIGWIVGGLVGLILLYFVIKSAIKNALHEDRLFQAKVAAGLPKKPTAT